ncbi:MAG: phosphoribosylanthranilate isomerase [Proteobacteria bacterium]|nr:phosphoribosylanthranilate isomerase [Pseudomonadota bacterium]
MVKIKLCGFSDKNTVDLAAKLGTDFLGFIFHQNSPRNISHSKAKEITADIPINVKKVAVVVNAENETIAEIVDNLKPDFLQLHGDESPERVNEIKEAFNLPIIKAIAISKEEDLLKVKEYEDLVEYFLFDTKVDNLRGGSGKTFDWSLLKKLKTSKNWFLSGGLNINNIDLALKITGANMVDISSGIEEIKGLKSPTLIENILKFLKEKLS